MNNSTQKIGEVLGWQFYSGLKRISQNLRIKRCKERSSLGKKMDLSLNIQKNSVRCLIDLLEYWAKKKKIAASPITKINR